MRGSNKWLFTLGLAQAGEFAFVLLGFSVSSHAMSKETARSTFTSGGVIDASDAGPLYFSRKIFVRLGADRGQSG